RWLSTDGLVSTAMARSMGIVCYVLAGLLLAAALVVPVVGFILAVIVWAWGAAAAGMALTDRVHDPAGVVIELIFNGVLDLLRALGPLPTILVVLITIAVEVVLVACAVILIVIGRRLRRLPRTG
ncbi:MAG TPA: hypothetical protein VF062_08770, partial [Candidatus Limnocylindrales bacterium]